MGRAMLKEYNDKITLVDKKNLSLKNNNETFQ